jgi:hypothetical protein
VKAKGREVEVSAHLLATLTSPQRARRPGGGGAAAGWRKRGARGRMAARGTRTESRRMMTSPRCRTPTSPSSVAASLHKRDCPGSEVVGGFLASTRERSATSTPVGGVPPHSHHIRFCLQHGKAWPKMKGRCSARLFDRRIFTAHLLRCTLPRRREDDGERQCDGIVRRRRVRLAGPAPAAVSSGGTHEARAGGRASRWHVARLRTTAVLSRVHVVHPRSMILPRTTPARPPPPPGVRLTLTLPALVRLRRELQLFHRLLSPPRKTTSAFQLSIKITCKTYAILDSPAV